MRALVHTIKGLELQLVERPYIKNDGEVLIELTSGSVCGSDTQFLINDSLHHLIGHIGGHEGGGRVVGVGKSVSRVKVDDLVAIESHIDRQGYQTGTDKLAGILGYRPDKRGVVPQGVWAEFVVVPEYIVFPIQNSLADKWPFCLWEPYCTSVHVYNEIRNLSTDNSINVMISGLGFQGSILSHILKHIDSYENLYGIQRSWQRRKSAHESGIFRKVYSNEKDEIDRIQEVDLWVDTTGDPRIIDLALKKTRSYGSIILFGLYKGNNDHNLLLTDYSGDLNDFISASNRARFGRITVIGVYGRTINDWKVAPEILAELLVKSNISSLYTNAGPIDNLIDILNTSKENDFIRRAEAYLRYSPVFKVCFGAQ